MKRVQPILVLFLLVGCAFCQEKDTAKIEDLDIAQIEEKAKMDAKTDFKKLKWIGKSFLSGFGGVALAGIGGRMLLGTHRPSGIEIPLLLGVVIAPTAAITMSHIDLPRHREIEIENQTLEYQNRYRSEYTAEIKARRYLYSIIGFSIGLPIYFFAWIWIGIITGLIPIA